MQSQKTTEWQGTKTETSKWGTSDRNHCVARTSKNSKNKTKANDRNHSALRTSKQHEQNKMTDV